MKLPGFADDRNNRVAAAILRAVLAHLYIAWIHPFGDGNGRTARLAKKLVKRGPDGYRAFTDRMKAFRLPSATTAPTGNASIPIEGGV